MQTKLYRQQHGQILRYLEGLDRMVGTALERDICTELSRLAGIVKLHLAMEDKHMYPSMLEHEDPRVRATAQEYMKTMSDLAPAYVAFHEKWIRSGLIDQMRDHFVREFGEVRDALRERIDQENRGLYDLIDENNIPVAALV